MRKGGGKVKGAAFERQVCKMLSAMMSGGQREDLFWRSAMSGGRATVGHRRGALHRAQAGDISAIDAAGAELTDLFYIECKNLASLNLSSLVCKLEGTLHQIWLHTRNEAKKYGKLPVLIAKEKSRPAIICLPRKWQSYFNLVADSTAVRVMPSVRFSGGGYEILPFTQFCFCARLRPPRHRPLTSAAETE